MRNDKLREVCRQVGAKEYENLIPPIPPLAKGGWGDLAGFTLIEVIVAIAILAISLVMVMQLFSAGLRVSRTSCDYTRAVVHAKDKMEELSLKAVQSSGKFEDGFEWETEVKSYGEHNEKLEELGVNLLEVKVKISWDSTSRQQQSIEMVSLRTLVKEENE
jgi:general secretion pathway protein I